MQMLQVQDSCVRINVGRRVKYTAFCSLAPGDLILLQTEVRQDDAGLLFFAIRNIHLLGRSPVSP